MRALVGFLFDPLPRYRVHVPAKTPADIMRAMNFSIWTAFMRHGKARADVMAEHGADGWRRVQRCFRAAFASKGPSIGLIGEASYLAGIEFKFDIEDAHPFATAYREPRLDGWSARKQAAQPDTPTPGNAAAEPRSLLKNPNPERETG